MNILVSALMVHVCVSGGCASRVRLWGPGMCGRLAFVDIASFHSHKWGVRVPVVPYPCKHLERSLISAISLGV